MSEDFTQMMEMMLQSDDPRAQQLAQTLAIELGQPVPGGRPPLPETMIGLDCAEGDGMMLAVGDLYSETGFNEAGTMTFMVNSPERPYGGVCLTREQVVQLRDYLTEKLG